MKYVYNDGGRSKYFKAELVGDCVCRAIAIANDLDYKLVYNELQKRSKDESKRKVRSQGGRRSSARDGVFKDTFKDYLTELGWVKHSTCGIGKGVSMHLTEDEVPGGTIICQISKHLVCVKDKVINDTYNSSIKDYFVWNDETGSEHIVNDKRAVYTYWTKEI